MRFQLAASTIFLVLCVSSLAVAEEGQARPSLEENLAKEIVDSQVPQLNSEPSNQSLDSVIEDETATIEFTETSISPKRIVLLPGATVVWRNMGNTSLQVHFIGKAISTTCKAPRGFAVGGKGVYQSSTIPPNGIASLCFLEPELYVFEIRSPTGTSGSDSAVAPSETLVGAVQIVRPK